MCSLPTSPGQHLLLVRLATWCMHSAPQKTRRSSVSSRFIFMELWRRHSPRVSRGVSRGPRFSRHPALPRSPVSVYHSSIHLSYVSNSAPSSRHCDCTDDDQLKNELKKELTQSHSGKFIYLTVPCAHRQSPFQSPTYLKLSSARSSTSSCRIQRALDA